MDEAKHYGSFGGDEWRREDNKMYKPEDFDFEFDEKEYDDVESYMTDYPDSPFFGGPNSKNNKDFNFTKPIVLNNKQIDIQFTNLNTKVSKDDFYFLQLFSNGNKTIFVENLYVEIEMSF